MIRRYRVERIQLVPVTSEWAKTGWIAIALARVDGKGVGPFHVMRHPDAQIYVNYALPLDPFGVPPCLHDAEVRTRIIALVKEEIARWKK